MHKIDQVSRKERQLLHKLMQHVHITNAGLPRWHLLLKPLAQPAEEEQQRALLDRCHCHCRAPRAPSSRLVTSHVPTVKTLCEYMLHLSGYQKEG